MKVILPVFLFILFLGCGTLRQPENTPVTSALEMSYEFPEDWLGIYTGTLQMYRPGTERNLYPAEVILTIAETPDSNRWEWNSVYTSEGREPVEKKYFIVHPDTLGTNQFVMDEDNGILIDQHLYGNTFAGAYTVNDQFFTFSYTKIGEELLYELVVYNKKPKELLTIEEGFDVGNLEMVTVQKVYFHKNED